MGLYPPLTGPPCKRTRQPRIHRREPGWRADRIALYPSSLSIDILARKRRGEVHCELRSNSATITTHFRFDEFTFRENRKAATPLIALCGNVR